MPNGQSTRSYSELLNLIDEPIEQHQAIYSKIIFRQLLRESVIRTANIRQPALSEFDIDHIDKNTGTFVDGSNISVRLFKLKNGGYDERKKFDAVVTLFRELSSGLSLDVLFSTTKVANNNNTGDQGHQTLVSIQPVVIDESGREFSLGHSGAGVEELAILATVLQGWDHQIILLDEPGVHVHPSIQRRIMHCLKRINNQVFFVTHSPYLLNSDTLPYDRRVSKGSGISNIQGPINLDIGEKNKLQLNQTFDHSSTMPQMLFASTVVLVEGATEFFALPIWFQKVNSGLTFEDLNIYICSVEGKSQFHRYLQYLESFKIPWVLLSDGDALEKGKSEITGQINKATGLEISIHDEFNEQKSELENFNVFVCGNGYDESFENIPEVAKCLKEIPSEVKGSKPRTAQWIANNIDSPKFINRLFKSAKRLSELMYLE